MAVPQASLLHQDVQTIAAACLHIAYAVRLVPGVYPAAPLITGSGTDSQCSPERTISCCPAAMVLTLTSHRLDCAEAPLVRSKAAFAALASLQIQVIKCRTGIGSRSTAAASPHLVAISDRCAGSKASALHSSCHAAMSCAAQEPHRSVHHSDTAAS